VMETISRAVLRALMVLAALAALGAQITIR
jgi:hypothetical protein